MQAQQISTEHSKRIFGFDLLRSVAILIVVLSHSNYLISGFFYNIAGINPPDGVDLFFVLSGYLIGTIIINTYEKNQKFDLPVVLHFLKRRWFRTLPNYFLFLLINIALIYFGVISGYLNKFLITFFVFFQNFYKPYDFLFWESWSITIEEWFYLLFPLILLVLNRIKAFKNKPKNILLFTIISFIVLPLTYRIFQSNSELDSDLYFRKLVLTRLDTIGFGLLAAYIHYYKSDLWLKYRNMLFFIGIGLLLLIQNIQINSMFFAQTFYFSVIGISILLLLPKLESLKVENISFKPFAFISKISYSLYFVHVILLQIISKFVFTEGSAPSLILYFVFWIVCIFISYIIYKFYEKPLMDLRDK